MALTFPVIGATPWGGTLNAALAKMSSDQIPDDHNAITWTYDPALPSGSTIVPTGTLNLMRVPVRANASLTDVTICVTTAGSTLTAGQNLIGLYDSTGTRVASTADQSGVWTSTGVKTTAWTVPYAATAGFYWIAMLTVGTTAPTIQRTQSAAPNPINLKLTAANSRYGTSGAGLTALPASFTPGTITQTSVAWWAAIA